MYLFVSVCLQGVYRLDGEGFSTVPLLVNHILTSKNPVTKRTEILLKRPILKVGRNPSIPFFAAVITSHKLMVMCYQHIWSFAKQGFSPQNT